MDGPLSKPLTAANAEKILVGLFTTETARDVHDRDQTPASADPLDPALRGSHGNKKKQPTDLVTRVSSPHAISSTPTEAYYFPHGAFIARALMQRLQELLELPRSVRRMWGYI